MPKDEKKGRSDKPSDIKPSVSDNKNDTRNLKKPPNK